MHIQIKSIISDEIIFEGEYRSIKHAVEGCVAKKVDLSDADLRGANLEDAYLNGANIKGADLSDTDLHYANLSNADLSCSNLRGTDLYGANLRGANLRSADLRGANLSYAYLYGANLYGADLSCSNLRGTDLYGANLYGANLYGANLSGVDLRGVPIIKDIHKTLYAAVSAENALNMSTWHTCDTTHCRAGWIIQLAGDAGKKLEREVGTPFAATLIYLVSDPTLDMIPNFYASNADAMADIKKMAGVE